MPHPVQTTSFIPKIYEDNCSGCGKCVKACPISAIEWVSNDDKTNSKSKKVKINKEICLGCGVCVRTCSNKSIILERRKEQIITPVNSVHRVVLMAVEKGKLPELIFDNQAFGSHRAMAAVLSAILKLPPIKQMMASKQMKSIYLEKLLKRIN
jgi:NAD-dependent dihydropyrimidine dehydrogenase PreA subunit